jgi:hypothetical protein
MKIKSNVRCEIVIALAGLLAPADAQWLHQEPRTPRTRDGQPMLNAPSPRLNGKPDLSGVWEATRPTLDELRSFTGEADPFRLQIDHLDVGDIKRNVFLGMKRAEEPLTPEAIAVMAKRKSEEPP